MITGVIEYKNGTLIVTLPCALYDLSAHLGSIGIRIPASQIPADGTEEISVKLAADRPIGGVVLSRITNGDTLSGVNLACQEINRACPFGYDEFMDMLAPKENPAMDRYHFYRQYETRPTSIAVGMKGLMEEVQRYRSTMENYTRACKAAEDEEYEMPEDEDWER